MVVTKKTESVFEVEFDASEQQVLMDIETIFNTLPVDVIQRSLDQAMREMKLGTTSLVDRVTESVRQRRSR